MAGRAPVLRALAGDATRMNWFREAKFGMFIHWGPYSVAGVEASWPIMTPTPEITEAEYRALPARFNPIRFDPHAWVALARAAGQRYMVFTAKHCDGFCMFDSDYTSYKITHTPYGKDIARQLADACHADGMPLGFYYSPPDMNHPGFRDTSKPSATNYAGEPERPEWPLYLEYMGLQLHELLTRYGPVAELWFDSDVCDANAQRRYDGQRILDEVHHLQPATLVNNRLQLPGDFITPEQFIPKRIPVKSEWPNDAICMAVPLHSASDSVSTIVPRPEEFQPWEGCMTINGTWSYRPKDRNFKSTDVLIRSLIEVISRGGNLLLDVGPQPDGQIQPEFVERLQALGVWTHRNAAAIYGSTYGPIQGQQPYRTTARATSIFVFVMDEAATELTVGPLERPVRKVRLLATGKPLAFNPSGNGIRIPLDRALRKNGIPVLEIRYRALGCVLS
jgi:alpha-L-fucosidase